jgi:hypothetical protein
VKGAIARLLSPSITNYDIVMVNRWTGFRKAVPLQVMKATTALLITTIGVGFTLGAAAQPGKHPGEKVDLKSLPASVQETIKDKAAGGKVTKVLREDDPDGKWNYEVFVTANGKESGFEIDPNGKFLKEHGE